MERRHPAPEFRPMSQRYNSAPEANMCRFPVHIVTDGVTELQFCMIFRPECGAASLWHAAKVTRYNKPNIKLLRRAKGTLLQFVGDVDYDMSRSFATPPKFLQPALAKARGLCYRVSRRRALPWFAANLWGWPLSGG